jgi:glutaredoxin
MREDAEDLRKYLAGKYGDNVKFAYVDVQSDDMNKYPAILETIKTVSLPLIVINGEPRFNGGFSVIMVINAIDKIINQS